MAFDPKSASGANLRWRGDYDAAKEYYKDDEIAFSGLTWRVRVEHVNGVAPPALSTTYSPVYEFISRQSGGAGSMTGAEIVAAIDAELGSDDWQDGGGAGGAVDLAVSLDASQITITPSGGGDAAVIPTATTDDAGAMSASMVTKLAGIEDGAEVNVATDLSIGTRTNTVVPLNSSTGTDVNLPQATTTLAGMMSGTDKTKLDGIEALADVTDAANVNAAGAVMEGDYDAQSILAAVSADTPIVVTFAASTFFGRKATGDVGAMSAAEARTVLNVENGAQVNVGTDLAIANRDADSLDITSSTGDDVTIPSASATEAGLMSAADKVTLDGFSGGATTLVAPQGRLTLTTATAVPVSDVAGATTVYYTPAVGPQVPVFDGTSAWAIRSIAELSLALDSDSGHTGYHQSGKLFDVFIDDNGGTPRLVTGPAWTSDTARADALVAQDGLLLNNATMTVRFGTASGNTASKGAKTLTYVGTIYCTANGQTEDSLTNRYVWNAYNRAPRAMARYETTNTWNYSTAAFRQMNGSTANQLNFIRGLDQDAAMATMQAAATNSVTTGNGVGYGIGLDSTTVAVVSNIVTVTSAGYSPGSVTYYGFPGLGRHFLAALEYGNGSNTQTWAGDLNVVFVKNGIFGCVMA